MFFKDSNTRKIEETMEQNINRELIEATQVMVGMGQRPINPFDNPMYPQPMPQQQYQQPQQMPYGQPMPGQFSQPMQGQYQQPMQNMPGQTYMPNPNGMQGKVGVPQTLPNFIISEYKNVMIFAIIATLVSLAIISIGAFFAYKEWTEGGKEFTGFIIPAIAIIVGSYKMIDSLLTWRSAKKDATAVKADFANGFHSIPRFITRIYRDLSVRMVDINWFAITSYVILGSFLLVITQLDGTIIPLINYQLNFESLGQQKLVAQIAIIAILVLHVTLAFWYRVRKERINGFYGFEIIPNAEIAELKKARNHSFRRILKVVLLLVFVVFVLIYKLIKRRK